MSHIYGLVLMVRSLASWAAWRAGVHREVNFEIQDLWKVDLRPFDSIVIFGTEELVSVQAIAPRFHCCFACIRPALPTHARTPQMGALEEKLVTEMRPDAQIVACRFPLKKAPPCMQIGEGIDSVWVYDKPGTEKSTAPSLM